MLFLSRLKIHSNEATESVYIYSTLNPLWPEFKKRNGKMGPIVIYYHVNIMESDFKLARQVLNEFVHPGHKGLTTFLRNDQPKYAKDPQNTEEFPKIRTNP